MTEDISILLDTTPKTKAKRHLKRLLTRRKEMLFSSAFAESKQSLTKEEFIELIAELRQEGFLTYNTSHHGAFVLFLTETTAEPELLVEHATV